MLGPLLLQPIVFVALMAAPAFFAQRAITHERASTWDVAVVGDLDAVPGLRAALDREPFSVLDGGDAIEQVAGDRAALAVEVPDDARARVRAGETVRLRVLAMQTNDITDRAAPALSRRLIEFGRAESQRLLEDAGQPAALASPLRVDIKDIATTSAEGIRFGLAQALPALLVIQLFGLVSLTQERLAGAKDKRVLEALLLLPVPRRHILLGIGSATTLVGALSSVVIFVPLTLAISAAVASLSRSLTDPLGLASTLVIGGGTLALTFAALGLMLGARASSGSAGSVLVTVIQLTIFATVIVSPFIGDINGASPVLTVPVLGPLLFVRDGLQSGPQPAAVLQLMLTQVAIAALLVRIGARALDADRSVLRVRKA